MPTYVRREDSDTWHWCTNCSSYPAPGEVADQVTLPGKQRPSSGELHNECRSKEDADNCAS